MSRLIKQNFKARNTITVGFSLLLVSLAVVTIAAVTSSNVVQNFDQIAYQSFMDSELTSLNDLVLSFEAQQSDNLPLALPSYMTPLTMDAGLTVFDAKGFPASFVKNLVPRFSGGVTSYPITVKEDSVTHARLVLNGSGNVIANISAPFGYNPDWLALEMFPNAKSSSDLLAMFDPSKISITYTLVDQKNLVNYLLKAAADVSTAQAQTAQTAQASPMMLAGVSPKTMYVPPVTNLTIAGVSVVSNGVKITIAYPAGFTNQLKVFATSDLISSWWTVVDTISVDTSTNAIEWVDLNTGNMSPRFLRVAGFSVDSDGDGLPDSLEKYCYHSNPNSSDSDSDGLSDYYEVMTLNTDPSNPVTNIPNAVISYPVNSYNSIGML